MLSNIENRTTFKNLPENSELKLVHVHRLGIIELDNGSRLIVRDGSEILVPKPASGELIKVLHNTYTATDTLVLQCKNRIFWLKMRAELETCYEHCQPQMSGFLQIYK